MYSKELELKILRTKHKLTWKVGTSVETLKKELENIPSYATIDEAYEKENDEFVIVFHAEKLCKEK